MLVFVRLTKMLHLTTGSSLVAGSLTLVIMILPTVIRTTQESLKTVPQSYREGALALGAKKWYMIRTIILPSSLDGIVTGCILSVGRIVGESAALLFTAGAGKLLAGGLLSTYFNSGATLSVGLYMYAFEEGKYDISYAIAAVLLVLVLIINPVSYTHLDVYKRQTSAGLAMPVSISSAEPEIDVRGVFSSWDTLAVNSWRMVSLCRLVSRSRTIASTKGCSSGSVSYTHLEVYKRQVQERHRCQAAAHCEQACAEKFQKEAQIDHFPCLLYTSSKASLSISTAGKRL